MSELDQSKLPSLLKLKYSSTADSANKLSGIASIRDAFIGFQKHLYEGDNRVDISIGEQKIWKRVKDPRIYSWDVKTKQSKLWQLLIDSVNLKPRFYHPKLSRQLSNNLSKN